MTRTFPPTQPAAALPPEKRPAALYLARLKVSGIEPTRPQVRATYSPSFGDNRS